MTKQEQTRLASEVHSYLDNQQIAQIAQIARTAAGIDHCMRMQEHHTDTALRLSEAQRRHLDA